MRATKRLFYQQSGHRRHVEDRCSPGRNGLLPTGRRAAFRLLVCLLSWLALPASQAASIDNYIPLDDYLQQNPQQRSLMQAFSAQVRAPAVPLSRPQSRPARIAIIYPALQASDYWRRSVRALEARLTELGIDYELQSRFSRPATDTSLQARQLEQLLDWRPDYLVFTLDVLEQRHMIEQVLVRGTPKLILQNITTPLSDWRVHPPFLYVGFDHQAGTRLLTEQMLARLQPPIYYAMLYFSQGYVSRVRGGTFARIASGHPGTIALGSYYTDGDRERARKATLHELDRNPHLNMLFAASTDIALGAAEALRSRNRHDQVIINGWGGGAAELEALARQELDLTVLRINDDNGVAMAEAIKADLEQRTGEVPQVFSGEMVVVTLDTPRETLEALTERAFHYSGND